MDEDTIEIPEGQSHIISPLQIRKARAFQLACHIDPDHRGNGMERAHYQNIPMNSLNQPGRHYRNLHHHRMNTERLQVPQTEQAAKSACFQDISNPRPMFNNPIQYAQGREPHGTHCDLIRFRHKVCFCYLGEETIQSINRG